MLLMLLAKINIGKSLITIANRSVFWTVSEKSTILLFSVLRGQSVIIRFMLVRVKKNFQHEKKIEGLTLSVISDSLSCLSRVIS